MTTPPLAAPIDGYFTCDLITMYDRLATDYIGYNVWRNMKTWRYYIKGKKGKWWIEVPYGFLTDGASIPKVFQSLLGPWGPYGQAAVGHDILCEYLTIMADGVLLPITREQCDGYLKEMMQAANVDPLQIDTIYSAVRLYAITMQVKLPSQTAKKRAMEASWVAQHPEGSIFS